METLVHASSGKLIISATSALISSSIASLPSIRAFGQIARRITDGTANFQNTHIRVHPRRGESLRLGGLKDFVEKRVSS
jgi:hypothetical protein